MIEFKNFIDICPVCKQGVTKLDMIYQKGRVFHTQCYITHGSSFPTPDSDLTTLNARTRIDLVQLKNLKVRKEHEPIVTTQVTRKHSPKKKTPKKKSTKPKTKNKKRVKAKKSKKRR